MSEKLSVYKCNVCGNIVEVIHAGEGCLNCCGVPMEQLCEKTNDDAAQEKHVPIITTENGIKTVRVGAIEHPMIQEHHIMFIEAISKDKKYITRKYLDINETPQMEFKIDPNDDFIAREMCNLHGLWSSSK